MSGVPARPLSCGQFLSLHHLVWVSLASQSSLDSVPWHFPPSSIRTPLSSFFLLALSSQRL